jgi:hypothetical protein
MKRKCKECSIELPLVDFPKNGKFYRTLCRPCYQIYNNAQYNPSKKKNYYINNKEIIIDNAKFYNRKRRKDPLFRLQNRLRTRIREVIKDGQKGGSAIKDLGCSMEFLKQYLESKFQPGMTWDNWSIKGWHIDHIIPLSKFDLTNREQFLKACHYTNLQPLWAIDNIRKGNNV